MTITEIKARSILRKYKKIESWFLTRYGMNLYRGCQHNCVYCDGRTEKYQVDGEFGEDVIVKTNAIDILKRELDPARKRTPFAKGYVGVGGGVGDSYQPIEQTYQLTRQTLELLKEKNHPVHILTKSTLVTRDIDLIKTINNQSKAIVSFSFSSADDEISEIFEPGVPPPSERLQTIKMFKEEGIACGMYLMPVIPFITDTREKIEETIKQAKQAGIDFIIFCGMTLKSGRQKQYFMDKLKTHYPDLLLEYQTLYQNNKWGSPSPAYAQTLNFLFSSIAKAYQIPSRIPLYLFKDIVSENDVVVVLLEHIDYLSRLKGKKSPFGYAAYSLSQIQTPLSDLKYRLQQIKGVGKVTERIITEILDTGTSSYYEQLLHG